MSPDFSDHPRAAGGSLCSWPGYGPIFRRGFDFRVCHEVAFGQEHSEVSGV